MGADVRILDVVWSPKEPQAGESISFQVEVRNDGDETADPVEVLVYVDGEISHVPPNFSLDPGEQRWSIESGNNSFDGGAYDAEAEVRGHDSYAFEITVDTDFGWIEGTVQTDDGDPVEGSRLYLRGDNISTRDGRVNDGEFTFEEVPPGDYTVSLTDTKYDGFSRDVTVEANSGTTLHETVSPQTYELTIEADPVSPHIPGEGTYEANETVVVEAPSEYNGYEFDRWRSPDGQTIWEDKEFELTMRDDRTIVAQYTEPGRPDLAVTGLSVNPSSPTDDDVVTFDVGLANRGDAAARNFDTEISTSGYVTRLTDLSLDAGASGTVYDAGGWEPESGTYTIVAEANYNRQIDENSYDDNVYSRDVSIEGAEPLEQFPDFDLRSLETHPSTPIAGEEVTVIANIGNSGDADASGVTTVVRVDGSEVDRTTHNLRSNDRKTLTIGTFAPDTAGSVEIEGEINPNGAITEESRADNSDWLTLTIEDDDQPEDDEDDDDGEDGEESEDDHPVLTVESVNILPSDPVVEDPITVEADVHVEGELPTAEVEIRLTVGGDHLQYDMYELSGGSQTVEVGEFSAAEPGEWTVEVTVDPYDFIETEPTDNDVRSLTVEVSEQTDVGELVSITETSPPVGIIEEEDVVTVSTEVHNEHEESVTANIEWVLEDDSGESHSYGAVATLPVSESIVVSEDIPVDTELPNGKYDILHQVFTDGETVASVRVDGFLTVDIDEEILGTLSVRTVDVADTSLGDVEVTLEAEDGSVSRQGRTNPGSVTFHNLPEGTYQYTAVSQERHQTVEGRLLIDDEVVDREMVFPESRPLSGVVIGANNEPVPDATVTVQSRDIDEAATTDTIGLFYFDSMVPAEEIEFTVETETGTDLVRKDTRFKDHVTLAVDVGGNVPDSQTDGTDADDDDLEELTVGEVSVPISLITRSPYFDDLVAQTTMPLRLSYGSVRGLITSLIDMGEGVRDTVLAIISGLMNLPGVVRALLDVVQAAWENRRAAFSYIGETILSAPGAAADSIRAFNDKQRDDNPYEPTDRRTETRYEQFKSGWYLGYGVGVVLAGKGVGKAISKGNDLFQSFDRVSDAATRASQTFSRSSGRDVESNAGLTLRNRVDIPESAPSLRITGTGVGGRAVADIIRNAPYPKVMEQWAEGLFVINHRNRGVRDDDARPSDPADLDRDGYGNANWFKDPSELTSGAIGSLKGPTFEALTIPYLIRQSTGEFADIVERRVMGRYDPAKIDPRQAGIVMTIDIDDLSIPASIRNDLNLHGRPDVDGELDLVRVIKREDGLPVVSKVYESKAGGVGGDDIRKKQETYDIIKQLDTHPDFDSTTMIGNSGVSVGAFTRGVESAREDPAMTFLFPSDGRFFNRNRAAEEEFDLDVDDTPVHFDVTSDQIEDTAGYIIGQGATRETARDRQEALEFLRAPTETYE